MPGAVIGKVMNLGWIGKVTRTADCVVDVRIVKQGSTPIQFGSPVMLGDDNYVENIKEGDTAAKFAGIAVASVLQSTVYLSQTAQYEQSKPCDILTRGSVVVYVRDATGVKAGGKVYVRTAANAGKPNAKIGDIEAAADSTNTIEIPASFTTGIVDGKNSVEITILTKNVI